MIEWRSRVILSSSLKEGIPTVILFREGDIQTGFIAFVLYSIGSQLEQSIISIGIHRLGIKLICLDRMQTGGSLIDSYARIFKSVKLHKKDLILPIFVSEPGNDLFVQKNDIPQFAKIGLKDLTQYVQRIIDLGISSVILFGVPRKRDIGASSAFGKNGVVQVTARKIKREFGELVNVITDVCICQYNLSGHCGLETKACKDARDHINNDRTIAYFPKLQSVMQSLEQTW